MNFRLNSEYRNISILLYSWMLMFFLMLSFGVKAQTTTSRIDSLEQSFKSNENQFKTALDLVDAFKNADSLKTITYLNIAKKLVKTKEDEVQFLIAQGSFLIVYGEMQKAIEVLTKASIIAQSRKNEKLEAKIYNNIGIAYLQLSNNTAALKYQLKALKIREQLNDPIDLEASNNNIGNIYFAIQNDEEALKYYKRALKYALELNLEGELGKIYNNIGAIFYDKNEYKQSKAYLLKGLYYKRRVNNAN